jgi:hypothetical protein
MASNENISHESDTSDFDGRDDSLQDLKRSLDIQTAPIF